MKHAKKFASLLLALVMILSLATTAFAQVETVDEEGDGKGSITISNAAKGETYTIYKLFDATLNADNTSIAYTGTIPDSLKGYFTADNNNYISAKEDAWAINESTGQKEMSVGLRTALTDWAKDATVTATAESDGSALIFQNVPYGYYVVTTTQGQQVISVDSTMPSVTIVDKNSSTPSNLKKAADKDDVNIGDTVTYTVTFKTSNYVGAGTNAKKVVTYTIEDTLPAFLKSVNVINIRIDNGDNSAANIIEAQFVDNKIDIEWYDKTNNKFLYNNGATVTITYTAVVTEKAAIDGEGNTNEVTLAWTDEDGTTTTDKLEASKTIYTYAIALKKVNDKGVALAGAVFEFPFYVKATADTTDGAYIYAGTNAGEGLTNQITTLADGVITIKGVASGEYRISEITAPAGYNKLLDDVTVTATKIGATTTDTTVNLDENGSITSSETNVSVTYTNDKIAATAVFVVNKAGTELPSTGGMGTTLFYVLGSMMVLAAVVLLVTKKRMSVNG